MEHTLDFNQKRGFICDMDGVIYHGNRVLPGVSEFIQWLHDEDKEYLFLTNNSGYTPKELQQKLARMGLDVPEEHFYTSALATAAFLKEQAPGCSAFVIGEAGLFNALYDAGITMNDVDPDYVVVGEGRSYSLDTITKATNLVLGGAKLIVGAIRGWTRDAGGRDVYGSLFHASLEEILNQAEPLGVPVALEAISRMDSDAYCSVAETADFIRSFHSSALRLQLDSIHLHTNGETQFCEEILRAGELIGQVDISDVGRMAPDGDHFDFPKLIQALKEIHYQDYLVFEYRAAPPEYAAKAGLDYIRSLL